VAVGFRFPFLGSPCPWRIANFHHNSLRLQFLLQ
jgi:hypothetical protein